MSNIPPVTDVDVAWACDVLNLPPTAFSGSDGTDPRLNILRSNRTLDIEACPGSGKTTLLVAKLAILARHWPHRTQGICVLSHTNAARHEIESRLGGTAEGQRLLRYPHFIGTIHGFVNEYLALPCLRSKDIEIKAIDDEICLNWRWQRLDRGKQSGLSNNNYNEQILRYSKPDFSYGNIRWSRGTLSQTSPTYQAMLSARKTSFEQGFFCHDEMFVWAQDLLETKPDVCSIIRQRFPLLFIDEVQDNSEIQSGILHRIFMDGDHPVTRLRFGDSNQAIYDNDDSEASAIDAFPVSEVRRDIPNSYRFGAGIAKLADPLALTPQSLVGLGGIGPEDDPSPDEEHAIFLLNENELPNALKYFAEHLRNVLTDEELTNGTFKAVGARHNPTTSGSPPRSVEEYWAAYRPSLTGSAPKPQNMVQFLTAGRRISDQTGEFAPAVDMIAQGLLKLLSLNNPEGSFRPRSRNHRYLLRALEGHAKALKAYNLTLRKLTFGMHIPTEADWQSTFAPAFEYIAKAVSKTQNLTEAATEFLAWEEIPTLQTTSSESGNTLVENSDTPVIKIDLGSIHSVKGETHTATLVLETYKRTHHLKFLKRWLLGSNSGDPNTNMDMRQRMTQHYVAMTRPSRLLCLAMRTDSFNESEIEKLKDHGWRVGIAQNGAIVWQ